MKPELLDKYISDGWERCSNADNRLVLKNPQTGQVRRVYIEEAIKLIKYDGFKPSGPASYDKLKKAGVEI